RAEPGAKPERVTLAHLDSVALALESGRPTPDRRARVISSQGDLWVVDSAGSARRLTETVSAETNPVFSADAREVYFVRAHNVYSTALDGGLTRQLTDIRRAGADTSNALAQGGRGGGGGRGGRGGQPTPEPTRETGGQAAPPHRGTLERRARETR